MIIAQLILALGYTGLLIAAIITAAMGIPAAWIWVFIPLVGIFLATWGDFFSNFSISRFTPTEAKNYLIELMINMSDEEIADLRKDYENNSEQLAFFDTLVEEAKKKRDENKED